MEEANAATTLWWNSAPNAATPTATPTCWKVSPMPEAMPAFSGRTTPMVMAARGGLNRPMPIPVTIMLGSIAVQLLPGSTRVIRPMPTAMKPIEAPISTPGLALARAPPVTPATTNRVIIIGMKRRPVSQGE